MYGGVEKQRCSHTNKRNGDSSGHADRKWTQVFVVTIKQRRSVPGLVRVSFCISICVVANELVQQLQPSCITWWLGKCA